MNNNDLFDLRFFVACVIRRSFFVLVFVFLFFVGGANASPIFHSDLYSVALGDLPRPQASPLPSPVASPKVSPLIPSTPPLKASPDAASAEKNSANHALDESSSLGVLDKLASDNKIFSVDQAHPLEGQARYYLDASDGISLDDAIQKSSEDLEIIEEQNDTSYKLNFQWFSQVGAAFFQRYGSYWLIFDKNVPAIDLLPFKKMKSVLKDFKIIKAGDALVFRFKFKDGWVPYLQKSDLSWRFIISKEKVPNTIWKIIYPVSDRVSGNIVFQTRTMGKVIHIKDDLIGDDLWVGVLRHDMVYTNVFQNFPLFNVIPSFVGVVMETLSDQVLMESTQDGFVISTQASAYIDEIANSKLLDHDSIEPDHLFNFNEWQIDEKDTYRNNYKKMHDAMLKSSDLMMMIRNVKFHLAYNLPFRALGMLNLLKSELGKSYASKTSLEALEGVADTLAHRYDDAYKIFFNNLNIPDVLEKKLWQAYILSGRGNYKEANDLYTQSDKLIESYPEPLKSIFYIDRLGVAANVENLTLLNDWIKKAPSHLNAEQKNAYQFYVGKAIELHSDENSTLEAYRYYLDLYKKVSVLKDPYNYYRILNEIVHLSLKLKRIPDAEAIKILRNISMNWRGDNMEFDCLNSIRAIYLKSGNYIGAFDIMADLVRNYPDPAVAQKIKENMLLSFLSYFDNKKLIEHNVLYSLEFYNKYRFLLEGNEGARLVVTNLSDVLFDNGLLKQARMLLVYAAQNYLSGPSKAKLGIKIAYIDLLQNNPKKALEDLKMTEAFTGDSKTSLSRGELKAKALIMLDRKDDALEALAGDVSSMADHLRLSIYWERQDWVSSVQVLQRLAGNPPSNPSEKLSEDSARYVLDWAVALKLSDDARGRKFLDELYGPFMQKTSLANLYNYVISPDVSISPDLEKTLGNLVGSKNFDTFLNDFKSKMKG